MTFENIKIIDKLFESYNYKTSNQSSNKVRIYTLRYGMYHAAEIIKFDKDYDVSKIKTEYSELGYATDIKLLNDIDEIEEYLFEGFFIKTPLGNELKNRYNSFVNKQLLNLPEGSKYKYIESSYDTLFQDENRNIIENKSYDGKNDISIISKINEYLSETTGAIFIIIEAPAGFGKTCTANEVLNTFSHKECKQLPFFTELSRNREARVFKHILLNEIDEQFPAGIKQNIVIEQISKGRIPLIIDGFDELISKESNKEEVESMLTTIIDLLKGNAKIVITSRKTAIFNSEEFLNSVYDSINEFSLARLEIKEPTIENWLEKERVEIIENTSFPINQIANPVLLSYLRNIPFQEFSNYLNSPDDGALIDKYLDYLLKREQQRQNLKLNKQSQLIIFGNLIRLMTEYNITSESKEIIKEIIKDFNLDILQKSLPEYLADEKPSIEDLVETLSNHAFLDKKPNGEIGFVNDFIFGYLVGENIINNKYQDNYPDYENIIPQDFAFKSIQSFKVQNNTKRELLWNEFNMNFPYDSNFYFELDFNFKQALNREYTNLLITESVYLDIRFEKDGIFKNSLFSGTQFKNCHFNISNFQHTTFQNCKFYNCTYEINTNTKSIIDFSLFTCQDDNNFIQEIVNLFETECELSKNPSKEKLTETEVLLHFFQVGNVKPRARKFSYIRKSLNKYNTREINKVIDNLKSKEYLHFKDDVGFITREAIYELKHNNII